MKKLAVLLIVLFNYSLVFSIGELNKIGLGVGIGGGGYETKAVYRSSEYFSFSLDYNSLEVENIEFTGLGSSGDDTSTSGIFKISGIKALAHFHPFANGLRVSGGYTYNLTDISMDLEGNSVSLGGVDTTLNGTLAFEFGGVLPYIGVGTGYSYEDFISIDFSVGLQFIKKISSDTITLEATVPEADLTTLVSTIGTAEGLTAAQQTQVINSSKDNIFNLDSALISVGVDTSGYAFPKSSDFIGGIGDQLDDLVNNSGLGMVQDLLGYAPMPVISLGFTVFLWN
jgi:hypothetical protein